jgi:hypothetical protein
MTIHGLPREAFSIIIDHLTDLIQIKPEPRWDAINF